MGSLNEEEFEELLSAMKTHEGWEVGFEEIIEVKKIINVRLDKKGVISDYLIQDAADQKWHSKDSAIAMAKKGLLHAIVVYAKRGTFLRSKLGYQPFKMLVVKESSDKNKQ